MRNVVITLCLFVFPFLGIGQSDEILGTWLNEKKDSKIEIYKAGNKYFGKIIWLKNNVNDDGTSPKLDKKNEDKAEQKKPIVGKVILTDLSWDADDKEWSDGEIYDPRGGSLYSCFARMEAKDKLFIKGYIGFSLIGRSTIWTRVK